MSETTGTIEELATPSNKLSITFVSSNEDETGLLAEVLVEDAQPGDVICLYGQVGAGKSVFSRAFVRAMAGDPHLVVPSPTFLLQQVYEDHPGTPVHHFDLYRLNGPTENFERLGLEDSFDTAVSLIEWPECLGASLPEEHLDIHIDMALPEGHEQALDLTSIVESLKRKHEAPEASTTANKSEGYLKGAAESIEDDVDEDEIDGYVEMEETYSDKRPRRFVLEAHGERWAKRLQILRRRLSS